MMRALAASLVLACALPSWAKIAVLDVGAPGQTGQETITITYKDAADVTHSLDVTTAQAGAEDTPEQAAAKGAIKKGQTDDQKAAAIAKAISDKAGANGPVSAASFAGVVNIGCTGSNKLEKVVFNGGNTDERHKLTYTDTVSTVIDFPANEILIATVRLEGAIAGITVDGEPAMLEVGTDRHVATLSTASFTRLSDLALALVRELEAHGVRVSLFGRTEILILVDPDVDNGVWVGDNDRALVMSFSYGSL
ncbi:MAG: hypothetical protein HY812_04935 [Planctomycetes bacterium]|nr:hypothetical protein [Planctomycetota bacterium]